MTNNLGLSFGLVIALFIPGFILLLSVLVNFYGITFRTGSDFKTLLADLKESYAFLLFVLIIISVTIGLLLDSIRYLITFAFQTFIKSEVDTCSFNDEDRKYFDWVVEHNFRFHQFYANICLGLFISACLLNKSLAFGYLWPFYFFSITCFVAAILSYKKALSSINDRITTTKKEVQS